METLGPYHFFRVVGRRGTCTVYRARRTERLADEQDFAVKVLTAEMSANSEVCDRFRREAVLLSMLQHRNIVRTYEVGEQSGRLFIAMEYVNGADLDAVIRAHAASDTLAPVEFAVLVVCEALRGLQAAHELCDSSGSPLPLVHRDIKPSNIFLGFHGGVKLGDFGVAELLHGGPGSGEVAGTPGYIAPEALDGGAVDQRSDLFGMGVVLFELLAGRPLADAEDPYERLVLNQHIKARSAREVRGDVPEALDEIIGCALSRTPGGRFASAQQMREALHRVVPDTPAVSLAVAAVMRERLSEEFERSLFQRPLASAFGERGEGAVAALVSDPESGRWLKGALEAAGVSISVFGDLSTLGRAVSRNVPHVLMVDTGLAWLERKHLLATFRATDAPLPTVCLCPTKMGTRGLRRAYDLGALDVLFAPWNARRVLGAVAFASKAEPPDNRPGSGSSDPYLIPVLLTSRDDELAAEYAYELSRFGFEVDLALDAQQALLAFVRRSYRAVMFDAPLPEHAWSFAAKLRALPGVGLLPVLALCDARPRAAGLRRVAALHRGCGPTETSLTLRALLARVGSERAFERYPFEVAVDLVYAGRRVRGSSTDCSLLGLGLECRILPPMGTPLTIDLHVGGSDSIRVDAVVARAEPPREGSPNMTVGLTFRAFAGQDEARWIAIARAVALRHRGGTLPRL